MCCCVCCMYVYFYICTYTYTHEPTNQHRQTDRYTPQQKHNVFYKKKPLSKSAYTPMNNWFCIFRRRLFFWTLNFFHSSIISPKQRFLLLVRFIFNKPLLKYLLPNKSFSNGFFFGLPISIYRVFVRSFVRL